MGCAHSSSVATPVPTAKDFYYQPSFRSLRHVIHEKVAPIDTPGMCYGFSMNTNKNMWVSQRSGLACHTFTDTTEGNVALEGLQLTGPTACGRLFLRDATRNIVAILKPIGGGGGENRTRTAATSFEIQCPKPYNQSCPKADNTCCQRNKNRKEENHGEPEWYTWAVVAQEPHSLTFDLTMVAEENPTVYTLQYCGGPGQMRVDKDGELRALIQNRQQGSWDIVVGAGVDPAMMLCYAAIVNQHARPVRASPR